MRPPLTAFNANADGLFGAYVAGCDRRHFTRDTGDSQAARLRRATAATAISPPATSSKEAGSGVTNALDLKLTSSIPKAPFALAAIVTLVKPVASVNPTNFAPPFEPKLKKSFVVTLTDPVVVVSVIVPGTLVWGPVCTWFETPNSPK